MKKLALICMIALLPMLCMAQNQNRQSARKIATELGACTLPDGSMGKMTVVERETTQTQSTSTSNSSSYNTSASASFEAGLTNVKGSTGASHGYNSGSSSQNGNTTTTKTKEECRPIPKW